MVLQFSPSVLNPKDLLSLTFWWLWKGLSGAYISVSGLEGLLTEPEILLICGNSKKIQIGLINQIILKPVAVPPGPFWGPRSPFED